MNDAEIKAAEADLARWRTRALAERTEAAHQIAKRIAALDRSDPFLYARVYSHLMNGVAQPSDYGK